MPRATAYELWLTSETSNFFTDMRYVLKCFTPHTSVTIHDRFGALAAGTWQRGNHPNGCLQYKGALFRYPLFGEYRWRVRAVDLGAADTDVHRTEITDADARFIRSAWSDRDVAGDPPLVTVTEEHPGAVDGLKPGLLAPDHCTNVATCDPLPDTPELVWTPATGATAGYWVQIALDAAFTNKVAEFHSYSARLRMDGGLLDNIANQSYYWRVVGCTAFDDFQVKSCWPDGDGNYRAFRKVGKAPTGLNVNSPCARAYGETVDSNCVGFSWNEQLTTAPEGGGYRGYQVQVSTDELFSVVVSDTKVDQPFTSTSLDLLQDGSYYWRVRAIDGVTAPLPWSAAGTFTKAAAKAVPQAVSSGPTAPVLRWSTEPGTDRYGLEIYTGANLSAGGNLVVSVGNLPGVAFTPTSVLAPGSYSWRVRRVDGSGNVLPWSAEPGGGGIATFQVTTGALAQESPAPGAVLTPGDRVLKWTGQSGVSRYRVQTATTSSFSNLIENVETVQTRWAMTAVNYVAGLTYYWRVQPLNAAGAVLSTTDTYRSFGVVTPPSAPEVSIASDGTTILVSWRAGSNGGATLLRYLVRYRAYGTSAWTQLPPVPGSETARSITGLATNTRYEAQVAAVNDVGTSAWSGLVNAVTASLPGAPDVSVSAEPGGFTARWQQPNDGGSPIRYYVVRWAASPSGAWSQVTNSGTGTQVVKGLQPGVAYMVQVSAVNGVGQGAFGSAQLVTAGAVAPGPVRVSVVQGTLTAAIRWAQPYTGGGQITQYELKWRRYDRAARGWSGWNGVSLPRTARTYVMRNLLRSDRYEVAVRAVSPAGTGAYGPTVGFTVALRPGAPTRVAATSRSGKVTLTWRAGAANGAAVTSYRILVSTNGRSYAVLKSSTGSSRGVFVWRGVKGRAYYFKVAGINSAGVGAASAAVRVVVR